MANENVDLEYLLTKSLDDLLMLVLDKIKELHNDQRPIVRQDPDMIRKRLRQIHSVISGDRAKLLQYFEASKDQVRSDARGN